MIRFTLDTNCIIALENEEAAAPSLRRLVEAHRTGRADVAVVAQSASEKQRPAGYLKDYAEFKERLSVLGLGELSEVLPMATWDISFFGRALWGDGPDGPMVKLAKAIHCALFPSAEYDPPSCPDGMSRNEWLQSRPVRKWRNRLCDQQIVWAHIWAGREVLVTTDQDDLIKKAPRLLPLGVGRVLHPLLAADLLP